MGRSVFSFILAVFATASFAKASLELPPELALDKVGFTEAPIIQCPKGLKKYEDMLEQLEGLKRKIRSEACPQSQLDALNKDVADIEKLVTTGREDFLTLINKGLGENQQLTAQEVQKLQQYIDGVVKKAASVTGLINNPACFDEGEKVSTLSFLSSLIGEASGIIGALTGPFGAKISLGGKLAAGLIGSIDTIVQARKTYDYTEREDRNNYLQNLCAYYEFKTDLDKETKVLAYSERLWDLQDTVTQVLNEVSITCAECRTAIEDFNNRVGRSLDYQVAIDPNSEALTASQSDELIDRPAEDMTLQDLYRFYFRTGPALTEDLISGAHRELPEQSPMVVPAMRLVTLRSLQAQGWLDREMQTLIENDEMGLSDDGRREVMRVQMSIESFLVDREGPRYIRYYRDALRKALRVLESEASRVVARTGMMGLELDPQFDYSSVRSNAAIAFHDLYRSNWSFRPNWAVAGDEFEQERLQIMGEMRQPLLSDLEAVRVDYSILKSRCEFFKKSSFGENASVQAACEQAQDQLDYGQQILKEILTTSFARRQGQRLEFVNRPEQFYVADWLASLTAVIRLDLEFL